MAVYKSLLLDAGGGIVGHNNHQADRWPGANVIIGLGGTGADAVIELKKEVYKRIKPDDVYAAVPRYNDIKFLIIDSDDSKIATNSGRIIDIDLANEFFSIHNKRVEMAFGTSEVLANRRDLKWLDYERISIDVFRRGAGCIRQVGRFLLVERAEKLYAEIKSTMLSALKNSGDKLTVHICAGISGGTGSGTFLDVCYLVQEALKEINKPEAMVCGYFFLPDVNLSVPAVAADPLLSKAVQVNGYAALKELDYCMNFRGNLDCFKMDYGFMKIEKKQKPVDLCFLVSAVDEVGNAIRDGYSYAISVVVEFVVGSIAKMHVPEGVENERIINKLDNVFRWSERNKRLAKMKHGAVHAYNFLGVSVAETPFADMAAYLGFKLFESYKDIFDRMPTEKERDEFLQEAQVTYEDIRKDLTKGCSLQNDFPQRYDGKLFKEQGNRKFEEYAEDEYLVRNIKVLETNAKAIMAFTKSIDVSKFCNPLIDRIYKILCEKYMTNLEYGPFFAQRMLCGDQNLNLTHAVDSFIAQNQNLRAELPQPWKKHVEYDNALSRMWSASFLNRKRRMEEYLYTLKSFYVNRYQLELLYLFDSVLMDYKQNLIWVNNLFFRTLTTVLDTLWKTLKENGRLLTEDVMAKSGCRWKIFTVSDIQESLDIEVGKLNPQQTFDDLMKVMMENSEKWVHEDEREISRLISEFILRTFRDVTQKPIMDYLKVKYQSDNIQILEKRIEEEIIRNKLGVDSAPMFWKDPMFSDEVGADAILTFPFDSLEMKEAASAYIDRYGESLVSEPGTMDRISMMRFYTGLPLYAYQGILELQKRYEEDSTPGRHLYERREMDWNKWLPSPVPASFQANRPIARIENRNNALIAEFKKAEDAGVVVQDIWGNWDIMVMDFRDAEAFVEAFIKAEGGYEINGRIDSLRLYNLVLRLETEVEKQESSAKPVRIASMRACDGCERQVMLDFYLKSPMLNRMLHEELEKREIITKRIKELSKTIEYTVISIEK